MSTATPTSVTDMKAAFPTPPEHLRVIGTPTLTDFIQILIFIARCAQTHKSTISPNMNLLYVAVPPGVYAHYTREAYPYGMYPYPPSPLDVPNFAGANGGTARKNIKIQHALEVKRYTDVQNMNTALIDTFLELMPPSAKIAYNDIRISNPNAVFREMFEWFLNKYGETQAIDRKKNIDSMTAPWSPNDGFDSLIHQLFLANTYAICANHPLQEHQILDAAVIVLQNCGLYPEEMKAWKKRTPAEGNDYAAFKIFWEQAIRIADTAMATPAAQYQYGMNINEVSDENSTTSRTSALENSISTFGSAYAATEERVRNQTDTINNLQGQLTTLQQQLNHSIMARPPMYPPPYNQRNNYYNNNQRGGRGGNQRRQHVPTGPPATQVTPPNPVRRFENMNYCHTHGGDVDDGHTSATCTRPGLYHNYYATRDNTMGGSISGLHKTILPSAVGRPPAPPGGGRSNTPYNRAPSYPTQQQTCPPPPTNPYNNMQPANAYNNMPPPMTAPAYNMPPPLPTPPMPMQQPQYHRAMAMIPPTMPTYQHPTPMMPAPAMPTNPMPQFYYQGYQY